MSTLTSEQVNVIVELLSNELDPCVVYLFGSAAEARLRTDSDIDIAYLSNHQLDDYGRFQLAQKLAGLLGRDVDLVDLEQSNTVFKAIIMSKGLKIVEKDTVRRMFFQMNAYKAYAKLNEERQCVLDKIRERGTIFDESGASQ